MNLLATVYAPIPKQPAVKCDTSCWVTSHQPIVAAGIIAIAAIMVAVIVMTRRN